MGMCDSDLVICGGMILRQQRAKLLYFVLAEVILSELFNDKVLQPQ